MYRGPIALARHLIDPSNMPITRPAKFDDERLVWQRDGQSAWPVSKVRQAPGELL